MRGSIKDTKGLEGGMEWGLRRIDMPERHSQCMRAWMYLIIGSTRWCKIRNAAGAHQLSLGSRDNVGQGRPMGWANMGIPSCLHPRWL